MTDLPSPDLGRVGVWSMELRFGDRAQALEASAELDDLGYGAIWVPGGIDDQVLGDIDQLLDATRRAVIATGIINIWKNTPEEVAAWFKRQSADRRARLMLGIGISHGPIIGEAWDKPLAKTRAYCDALDAAGMPRTHTCIAALGPRMTALSGERTAGSHPYLTNPEHTREARDILGPAKLLAPEQGVVLETDPGRARAAARGALEMYRTLPNYRNSWKRLGFSEEDIETLSDRLIDAIFAWGDAGAVKTRVDEHVAAGASHVCVQVLGTGPMGDVAAVREKWRELAAVLL